MNKMNEVTRYIRPMVLWSVVRSRFDSREPFTDHVNRARPTHDGRRCNRHAPELRRCLPATSAGRDGHAGDRRPCRPGRDAGSVDADLARRRSPRPAPGSAASAGRTSSRARCRACGPMPTSVADRRPVQPQPLPVRPRVDRRPGAAPGSPPAARPCPGRRAAAPADRRARRGGRRPASRRRAGRRVAAPARSPDRCAGRRRRARRSTAPSRTGSRAQRVGDHGHRPRVGPGGPAGRVAARRRARRRPRPAPGPGRAARWWPVPPPRSSSGAGPPVVPRARRRRAPRSPRRSGRRRGTRRGRPPSRRSPPTAAGAAGGSRVTCPCRARSKRVPGRAAQAAVVRGGQRAAPQTGQASSATAAAGSGGARAHRAGRDGVEGDVAQLAVVGDRGDEGAVRLAATVGRRAGVEQPQPAVAPWCPTGCGCARTRGRRRRGSGRRSAPRAPSCHPSRVRRRCADRRSRPGPPRAAARAARRGRCCRTPPISRRDRALELVQQRDVDPVAGVHDDVGAPRSPPTASEVGRATAEERACRRSTPAKQARRHGPRPLRCCLRPTTGPPSARHIEDAP